MTVTLHLGDCLDVMRTMPAESVDAIITDLPYGTTACKWDTVIPFAPMWEAVKHVLKPRGVFVTTASQPFTSALVMSNPAWFKYAWVWNKVNPSGFHMAKIRPMKQHEDVLVFSHNGHTYNPIKTPRGKVKVSRHYGKSSESNPIGVVDGENRTYTDYYPKSIVEFSNAFREGLHPTQKPVALYDYLIRTYTNPGEVVLDMCAGSGTTGIAAIQTGRNAILIERDPTYYAIAERRIRDAQAQPTLEGVNA